MKKYLLFWVLVISFLIQHSVIAADVYISGTEFTKVSYELANGDYSIIYGTDSYIEKSEELKVSTTVQALAANGKRVQLSAGSGVELPQSIKYEFEILTPGSYKLNLVAGQCDVDWLSKYNVKIDGKAVEVKGANMTSKTVVADTSNLFISGELKERFNLDRGKHTFEIEVISYRTSGSVLTCFESAEFVRVSEIKETIYGSVVRTDNVAENSLYGLGVNNGQEYSSRGTTICIRGGSAGTAALFPTEGFIFDYEFDVEVEGVYELSSFIAGDVDNAWLSKISVAVDDGTSRKINSNTYTSRNEIVGTGGVKLLIDYTTDLQFYLSKGTHHFKFILPEHNTTRNGTYTYFDKAELSYLREEDDIAVEGENCDKLTELYADEFVVTKLDCDGQEVTVSFPFSAEEEGIYKMNVSMGGSWETVSVSVDGSDYRNVPASLSEMSSENVSFYEDDEEKELLLNTYTLPYTYDLKKGIHNVNIRVKSSEKVYIKNIELNLSDSKELVYINGADSSNFNSELIEKELNGSQGIYTFSENSDGYLITYPFTVFNEGYYQLDAISVDEVGVDYCNITVDNFDYLDLSDSASYIKKEITDGFSVVNTNKRYYLKKGHHEVKLLVSYTDAEVVLDYVKLSLESKDTLTLYGTDAFESISDGEFFAEHSKGSYNVTQGYKNLCIYGNTSPVEFNYKFQCQKTGYYSVNIIGTEGLAFGIDGEKYTINENYLSSSYYDGTRKVFKMLPTFFIEEGEHTFVLYIDDLNAVNYFSCVKFNYLSKPGDVYVNFEENNNPTLNGSIKTSKVTYNNGKYHCTKLQKSGISIYDCDVSYPFYINEDAEYRFTLVSSDIGRVKLSIDGNEYRIKGVTPVQHSFCSNLKIYQYSDTIPLTKGMHTVKFTLDFLSSSLDIDYVSFEKITDSNLFIYTQGEDYLEIGNTLQAVVWDRFEEESEYQSIAFSSSDENILTIGEDGVVTGVGIGKANVCAEITLNDGSVELLSKEMKITDDGIFVDFPSLEMNGIEVNALPENGLYNANVKFKVINFDIEDGNVALFVAIYRNNQLSEVKMLSDDYLKGCDSEYKNINISNVNVTDNTEIAIFAWDGISGLKPLIKKQIFMRKEAQ